MLSLAPLNDREFLTAILTATPVNEPVFWRPMMNTKRTGTLKFRVPVLLTRDQFGGDGGESNSPSKQVTATICYRRSRHFVTRRGPPSAGFHSACSLALGSSQRTIAATTARLGYARTRPIRRRSDGRASTVVRRRERELADYWQLYFCRWFNEGAYRHLGLQTSPSPACRNPTSPRRAPSRASSVYHIWARRARVCYNAPRRAAHSHSSWPWHRQCTPTSASQLLAAPTQAACVRRFGSSRGGRATP